jgi:hypothetical protein
MGPRQTGKTGPEHGSRHARREATFSKEGYPIISILSDESCFTSFNIPTMGPDTFSHRHPFREARNIKPASGPPISRCLGPRASAMALLPHVTFGLELSEVAHICRSRRWSVYDTL